MTVNELRAKLDELVVANPRNGYRGISMIIAGDGYDRNDTYPRSVHELIIAEGEKNLHFRG